MENEKYEVAALVLAIIALVLDAIFTQGFNRLPQHIPVLLLIYLPLILTYFGMSLIDNGGTDIKSSVQHLGLAALLSGLQVAIPYFALKLAVLPALGALGDLFVLIIPLLCPWLFYYLFINPLDGNFVVTFRIIWIIAVTFVILAFSFTSMLRAARGVAATSTLSLSPAEAFKNFWSTLGNKVTDIGSAINESINTKLRPENVKSRVDKNSDSRLGVFLKDIKILFSKIYENEKIDILGTMEANSIFTDIKVDVSCYSEEISSKIKTYGEVDNPTFYIMGHDVNILQCNFPYGLNKGRYNVFFDANFNFETWAYLDYTFVDKSLAIDYLKEDRNINQELNIDVEPVPIFTDGPVTIGMIAASQPVLVDFTRPDSLPAFGIVIEKNWDKGDISTIYSVTVQMPQMISLESCTPSTPIDNGNIDPESGEGSDYFHYYEFENPTKRPDFLENIVCRMNINQEEYNNEKMLNQKLVKTAVVTANYQYNVPSSGKSFYVDENPN